MCPAFGVLLLLLLFVGCVHVRDHLEVEHSDTKGCQNVKGQYNYKTSELNIFALYLPRYANKSTEALNIFFTMTMGKMVVMHLSGG